MAPRVSVILPTWNRASSLPAAIESVLAQTYRDLELIVVDDGSSDDTDAVLETYRSRIRVLRQPNRGAYAARNLALRHCAGELVAFIDSDDVWYPHRLERQVPLFSRPAVGLVFGNARIAGTRRTTFDIAPPKRGRVAEHFVWGNFVATSSVLVRREVLGFFPESARLSADYLVWVRIALRHELVYPDAEPLLEYRVHEGGISYDLARALETRIELFREERARTADRGARRLFDRILFHLAMHLTLATLRGRARRCRLAWSTARTVPVRFAVPWLFAFVVHHAVARGRRFFA
jgi:glycosyltransferase involved in cell wall biosynthesis